MSLTPALMEIAPEEARDWLRQARDGDPEAFDEVCRAHAPRLLRQAFTLCGNESMAQELAQDTLVEAWRCLPRYNGSCQFFTWLCAILLHRHRNSLRAGRWLRFTAPSVAGQEPAPENEQLPVGVETWPDQVAQAHEQARLLRKCIQTLPSKHREVIFLRFYADDSLEGIAAALGCSVGTVKSRLFHALEKLRKLKELRRLSPSVDLNVRSL